MQGIVSLLDETHRAMVEHIQSQLERVLGVSGLCQTPIPHFSYHVADEYDLDIIPATLLAFAASNAVFRIRTAGLGIFPGKYPVLYIPVVRSPILSMMHHVMWRQLTGAASGVSAHYAPDRWVPHITLADREDLAPHLPDIMRLLTPLNLAWEIEITNVALLFGEGEALEVKFRHKLAAGR